MLRLPLVAIATMTSYSHSHHPQLSAVFPDNNGGLRALEDISFDVYPREFVCVLGPSGSGKTTLLRILGRADPSDLRLVHVWSWRTAKHRHGLSTGKPDAVAHGDREHQTSAGGQANG